MRWAAVRGTARTKATLALSAALGIAGLAAAAGPAGAAVFSNTAPIVIPAGPDTLGRGNPFPSEIAVAGLTGTVTNVTATVTGLRHTAPADVELLLVGPSGQTVTLLGDTGGGTDITNANLTFSSAAATPVPAPIVSGTFRPTAPGPFTEPPPAPPGPYGSTLSVFNGTVANGTWRLFAFDDAIVDTGAITGGWSLDITTNGPTIASFAPTTGPAGTPVVITGTNLTGATAVTFGGVPSTSVTVNNPTTVTATVPAGAVTGPITVTTPSGSASSTTNFEASPPPTITAVGPDTGAVGARVMLSGQNLTGATAVTFGGTPATQFTVTSANAIEATVPNGAGGGPVVVTTPGGTGTSSQTFTVTHARSVSLAINRRGSRGTVSVTDGFSKCAAGATVTLQRQNRRKAWRGRGSAVTGPNGGYSIPGRRNPGTYRVVVSPQTLPSSDSCLQAVSDPVQRN